MLDQVPLVADTTTRHTRQLATGEDLDIPLQEKFDRLQRRFNALVYWLVAQDILVLPEHVTEGLDDTWE